MALSVVCCCYSVNRKGASAGSNVDPREHWSATVGGRPASHDAANFTPVRGQWRLLVGKDSVRQEDEALMSGSMVGRQVWRCEDPDAPGNPLATFSAAANPNASDKLYHIQQGCPPVSSARSAEEAANTNSTAALRQGVHFYRKLQSTDGHWPSDYGGPMFLMPGLVITMYVSGTKFAPGQAEAMITYLRNHQQKNGGWGLHIESPSTMFGTTMNYVAARLLGLPADDPVAVAARRFILDNGGAVGVPSWGKFWLSTLGVYSWEGLNPVPPELWMLPYWIPFHPGRMWCHARMVYLPMSYIYGNRYTATPTPLIEALRSELYTVPYAKVNWFKARNFVSPLDLYSPHSWVMRIANRVLGWYERLPLGCLRRRGLNFALAYIHAEDMQTNYVDIGPVNKTLNMLSVFYAHGADSEAFKRHTVRVDDYLWLAEDGMRMQGYNGSQLWDTAFAAQALLESGLLEKDAVARRTLLEAHRYVDNTQVRENVPQRARFYRHISKGGWPFSTADHGWPIADCTAEGLKVCLGVRRLGVGPAIADSRFFDAINVILSFQNADGGWATYELNRGWRWYEHLNPAEVFGDIMIDYTYVELTSACTTALAEFRKQFPNHRAKEVRRAITRGVRFVAAVQRNDGSWYGSWAICFTYGTWFGVEALMAGGATPESGPIQKAVEFLVSKQNDDGGWGESYLSCLTRKYLSNKQEGSQAVNTAWALLALMAAQTDNVEAVQRGIRFLVQRQLTDGDWEQESIMGVFNRTTGITYANYRNAFPLWALGRYNTEYVHGPFGGHAQ